MVDTPPELIKKLKLGEKPNTWGDFYNDQIRALEAAIIAVCTRGQLLEIIKKMEDFQKSQAKGE